LKGCGKDVDMYFLLSINNSLLESLELLHNLGFLVFFNYQGESLFLFIFSFNFWRYQFISGNDSLATP
jgi:hypothetical protein